VEAEVRASVDEGELNSEPEEGKKEEGGEWDGSARCLSPDKEVEDEDKAEEKARDQESSLWGVSA
jgi:hypothetical protein